jgi:hypothetical protein
MGREGRTVAETDALGRYLQDIQRAEPLTRERESALEKRLIGGDERALDEYVVAHLRLVATLAKRFAHHAVAARCRPGRPIGCTVRRAMGGDAYARGRCPPRRRQTISKEGEAHNEPSAEACGTQRHLTVVDSPRRSG